MMKKQLFDFISAAFGDIAYQAKLSDGLDMALVAPQGDSKCFITVGMSENPMPGVIEGLDRAELMLCASSDFRTDEQNLSELGRALRAFSKLPFERNRAFEMGEVLDCEDEMILRYGYEKLLVFPVMQKNDTDDIVNFFVLIPIYKAEAEKISRFGWESFVALYSMTVEEKELFCFDVKREAIEFTDDALNLESGSCEVRG
jgi:hypothetical protein